MKTGGDENRGAQSTCGRVFLSYTRADIGRARWVIALLEGAGFEVWWDGLLEGGENYLPTTEAALENADCVVVLWSKTSVDSHWVRDEAQNGRERGCLIPLSLDGTIAPLGFRQFQLIDISTWKGRQGTQEAERVLTAVRANSGANPLAGGKPAALAGPARAMQGAGISRRAMVIGGLGLTGGAAAIGAWQFGAFGPRGAAAISMAVLRFSNLSGNTEQVWFSDGLSNELRSILARNPRLRVSAPTSSTAVGQEDDFAIGRALGVRYVLRGGVQRVAETVRISAELVQVEDGLVRWANSFDRGIDDVLAVQTEIAETVALSLVTQIASETEVRRSLDEQQGIGGTDDITAYEAYLRGRAFYDLSAGEDSDRAALAQFDAAIAADPDYAAAHAMRATMLAAIANATSDAAEVSKLYDRSISSARRAIRLEPKLGQGHLALGFALNNGKLNRKEAYSHYKSAQELAPGDADAQRSVATFYAYGDQQALATQMINGVLELDPLNARAFRAAGFIAFFSRDYSNTIARMKRAIELNPQLASAHFAIGSALYMQTDFKGALESFGAETVTLFKQTGIAMTQNKLGNAQAARDTFRAMVAEYGDASLYQQAQVLAQWSNIEEAFRTLAKAFAQRDPGVLFAPNDPLLDPLRDKPEIDRLLLQLAS